MKIDFLFDMTDGGKYPHADPVHLVRLYDFSESEAELLAGTIEEDILNNGHAIQVDELAFVETHSCTLRFELSTNDVGIELPADHKTFICRLTRSSYSNMPEIIRMVTDGFNWLYNPGTEKVDLLISTGGTW
jgi:hypothetical protein